MKNPRNCYLVSVECRNGKTVRPIVEALNSAEACEKAEHLYPLSRATGAAYKHPAQQHLDYGFLVGNVTRSRRAAERRAA